MNEFVSLFVLLPLQTVSSLRERLNLTHLHIPESAKSRTQSMTVDGKQPFKDRGSSSRPQFTPRMPRILAVRVTAQVPHPDCSSTFLLFSVKLITCCHSPLLCPLLLPLRGIRGGVLPPPWDTPLPEPQDTVCSLHLASDSLSVTAESLPPARSD